MSKNLIRVGLLLPLCMAVGCASGGSAGGKAAEAEPAAQPVPPDSPFAKVKLGMDSEECFAAIGRPTSQKTYQTGKAWIPFRIGGDNYRTSCRYKGQGVLTFKQDSPFSSSMVLLEIWYDPAETGYPKAD